MNLETKIVEPNTGFNGLCQSCLGKEEGSPTHKELFDRLSSAVRLVKFALAACFFFCTLLILMFSCSLYLAREIQIVRKEISRLKESMIVGDDTIVSTAVSNEAGGLFGDLDYQETVDVRERRFNIKNDGTRKERTRKAPKKKDRGKKRKKNPCCKCCKKVRDLERSVRSLQRPSDQQPQPSTTHRPVPQDNNRFWYIAAAHYSTYMTEDFVNRRLGALDPGNLDRAVRCTIIPEWHGEACRNRTFTPHHDRDGSSLTLNVFKEADWMKNVSQERLFNKTNNGVFIALHSGIYLLYTHVLFYDVSTKQAVAIVHQSGGVSKNVLRCMESVDYVDPAQDIGKNSKYKSCSVNGVLYMSAGDTVMVKNLYSHTRIDLTSDATYFGGLLFAARTTDL